MTARRLLLGAAAAASLLGSAAAQDQIPVVATFSILGDIVKEVGGDAVEVTTLVGPDGDAHVYEPSPADARKVTDAKVLFVNGLNMEGWIDRLTEAADFKGRKAVLTEGVAPLEAEEGHDHGEGHGHGHGHDHGEVDPHAWQDLANGKIFAENVARALCDVDSARCPDFKARAVAYIARLDALDAEIKAEIAAIPAERRRVVTSHDAFGYFERAYGIEFLSPQGISTESEASAKDVAELIRQIKAESIPAVFVETVTDPRLIERIAQETGAKIGGALYSDALSPPEGPAATYEAMFRHNAKELVAALKP